MIPIEIILFFFSSFFLSLSPRFFMKESPPPSLSLSLTQSLSKAVAQQIVGKEEVCSYLIQNRQQANTHTSSSTQKKKKIEKRQNLVDIFFFFLGLLT